jgi:hypothetical protein
VDIYAQGIVNFAGVQSVLQFIGTRGQTPGAFQLSMTNGNAQFAGQAIAFNQSLFGSVFPIYVDSPERPHYREAFGFMLLGGSQNLIAKTWLLSVTCDYSVGPAAAGVCTIDADRTATTLAGNASAISCEVTPGKATFAKWPIPGDVNRDCTVSILDMIIARSRLNDDVNSGDNWKADVNEDGKINVLDLMFIRGRLFDACNPPPAPAP